MFENSQYVVPPISGNYLHKKKSIKDGSFSQEVHAATVGFVGAVLGIVWVAFKHIPPSIPSGKTRRPQSVSEANRASQRTQQQSQARLRVYA